MPFYLGGSESDFKNNGHVKVNFNLLAARPACGAEAGTLSCEWGGDVPHRRRHSPKPSLPRHFAA